MVRQPDALWRLAGLPEDVDRDATARIPVGANPQPLGIKQLDDALGEIDRAILVEGAVIAEGKEKSFSDFDSTSQSPGM